MIIQHMIYLTILAIAFVTNVLCAKSHPSLKVIPYVLGITVITEGYVNIAYLCEGNSFNANPIYHFFIPLEYSLLAYFFSQNIQSNVLKKVILASIFIFAILGFFFSWYVVGLQNFPGHNYNIGGILLCTWALIIIFKFEVTLRLPIYKFPIFWICLGILVFHLGMFTFNGLYNKISVDNREAFKTLRQIVEKTLNSFLYFCYLISAICSQRIMKS